MSHKDHTAAMGNSMANPYSCAYHRGLGKTGIPSKINGRGKVFDTSSYGNLVV
jgi:hypothetical protein